MGNNGNAGGLAWRRVGTAALTALWGAIATAYAYAGPITTDDDEFDPTDLGYRNETDCSVAGFQQYRPGLRRHRLEPLDGVIPVRIRKDTALKVTLPDWDGFVIDSTVLGDPTFTVDHRAPNLMSITSQASGTSTDVFVMTESGYEVSLLVHVEPRGSSTCTDFQLRLEHHEAPPTETRRGRGQSTEAWRPTQQTGRDTARHLPSWPTPTDAEAVHAWNAATGAAGLGQPANFGEVRCRGVTMLGPAEPERTRGVTPDEVCYDDAWAYIHFDPGNPALRSLPTVSAIEGGIRRAANATTWAKTSGGKMIRAQRARHLQLNSGPLESLCIFVPETDTTRAVALTEPLRRQPAGTTIEETKGTAEGGRQNDENESVNPPNATLNEGTETGATDENRTDTLIEDGDREPKTTAEPTGPIRGPRLPFTVTAGKVVPQTCETGNGNPGPTWRVATIEDATGLCARLTTCGIPCRWTNTGGPTR